MDKNKLNDENTKKPSINRPKSRKQNITTNGKRKPTNSTTSSSTSGSSSTFDRRRSSNYCSTTTTSPRKTTSDKTAARTKKTKKKTSKSTKKQDSNCKNEIAEIHKASEVEVKVVEASGESGISGPFGATSIDFNDVGLRWDNVCDNPLDEMRRIEAYKANRRLRYTKANNMKIASLTLQERKF